MSIAPPTELVDHHDPRFKVITSPCEWVEEYRPGGYHPIHLGDTFNDRRYEVLRKLGEGSYSTVWLARDMRAQKYVALKILVSEKRASASEVQILRHIAEVAPREGSRHVTLLLDEFEHRGPNGIHNCLVFEPMGPNVNTMVEELPQFNPRTRAMKVRYPPRIARCILKQALEALSFLHENGIAHGDLQPGNMLLAINDIDSEPLDVIRQKEDVQSRSISAPIQRLDGKPDLWAPRYLCIAQPLVPFTDYSEQIKIKLSDMGGAYFFKDPPVKPITPLGLRPPELVLTGKVDKSLDIWSFGCLVFELVTGQPLFCVPRSSEETDDYLLALHARLGVLPEDLFKHWKNSAQYFTADRKLYNCRLGGVSEGEEPLLIEDYSMEQMFDMASPEIGQAEAEQIKTLVRKILQYNPAKRPSAEEILMDPWFAYS